MIKTIKNLAKDNRSMLVIMGIFATALVLVALFLIFMMPAVFA